MQRQLSREAVDSTDTLESTLDADSKAAYDNV